MDKIIKKLLEIRDRCHPWLMEEFGIVGTALGKVGDKPAILVLTETDHKDVPSSFDGVLLERIFCSGECSDRKSLNCAESNLRSGGHFITTVQKQERFATIGALVTDGRTTYALTNAHARGAVGTAIDAIVQGNLVKIGEVSDREVCKYFMTDSVRLNLDAGLIVLEDPSLWEKESTLPIINLYAEKLSLDLIGTQVSSESTSGLVRGLFYRYQSLGGIHDETEFLIDAPTCAGHSGSVFKIEGQAFAMQWGRIGSSFVLASSIASILARLDVGLLGSSLCQPCWGPIGHYIVACKAIDAVQNPKLWDLLNRTSSVITFSHKELLSDSCSISVIRMPLADISDVLWRNGRPKDADAHFWNIDQRSIDPVDRSTKIMLDISTRDSIDLLEWKSFYSNKRVGCLPLRIWQVYDEMVRYLLERDIVRFVTALGILAHYVGDACQPMHTMSAYTNGYFKDGIVHNKGIHSAFEGAMITAFRREILSELQQRKSSEMQRIQGGRGAANAIIALIKETLWEDPLSELLNGFSSQEVLEKAVARRIATVNFNFNSEGGINRLWNQFDTLTINCLEKGIAVLAMLWNSAWQEGKGDEWGGNVWNIDIYAPPKLIQDPNFLPSMESVELIDFLHRSENNK